MPRRSDIKTILMIGSGPIVIGQACEFDYSGTQACRVLKAEGYKVVLINSNPATIMTDTDVAHQTYIEPITAENIKKIIIKEKVDAILPTVGGQTALNVATKVADDNIFCKKHGVQLIGANLSVIKKAEDRQLFKTAMTKLGFKCPRSAVVKSYAESLKMLSQLEFPIIIRASFTLGGTGGSIANNQEEFKELVTKGIALSMIGEVSIEESILGWKEYELEVMRDLKDNVVIVCSIENVDAVGTHTGDSITVAPQQTLTDKEYQNLRNMSIKIIREIGVETGGSNIQFAIHPTTREVYIIEMNPRVSRSSALASKATGFPIAKIATMLAIGYTLDEIPNDITEVTPACFEPTLDYVVTKIPRFTFEKFRHATTTTGVQMKSIGEAMAIGTTFKESFQKAFRSLENKSIGFDGVYFSYAKMKEAYKNKLSLVQWMEAGKTNLNAIKQKIIDSDYKKFYFIKDAFFLGLSLDKVYELCSIDKWFLHHLRQLVQLEKSHYGDSLRALAKEELYALKQAGFSDLQLSVLLQTTEERVRNKRARNNIAPVFKVVDTCAGEFVAKTPYYYSTYGRENEYHPSSKKKVIIIGSGPNRIGQGIEFDYMCVKATMAAKEAGYEAIMVNSNPETISTDYNVSDVLFLEPITLEDVLHICKRVMPYGVILQFGGQTPLNLAASLAALKIPMIGTSTKSIEIAENRNKFTKLLHTLHFRQPPNASAESKTKIVKKAEKLGYPLIIRPSFVLGGRAMEIVYNRSELDNYIQLLDENFSKSNPVLIDKYLENALEVDVDVISDGKQSMVCSVMEHIEEAGIHSGDSACVIPPQNLSANILADINRQSILVSKKLSVIGFLNIQFAIKDNMLYFIEVNPRGSRTVPFVCKTTGISWVDIATHIITKGASLKQFTFKPKNKKFVAVKEAVFPFDKFPEEDIVLGPEMKSTGEVMGISTTMSEAYYKAQEASYQSLPMDGGILCTISSKHRNKLFLEACTILVKKNFKIYATKGTASFLDKHNIESEMVTKIGSGRPDVRDKIIDNQIQLIFNIPSGKQNTHRTGKYIRILAKQYSIPTVTTVFGINAIAKAIALRLEKTFDVKSLQDFYAS